jgi:hypothetical protein
VRLVGEGKGSERRALTTSTPRAARDWPDGLEGSRVIARSLNSFESTGWARTTLMTEPPWVPVAPKTVRSLLMMVLVMMVEWK